MKIIQTKGKIEKGELRATAPEDLSDGKWTSLLLLKMNLIN